MPRACVQAGPRTYRSFHYTKRRRWRGSCLRSQQGREDRVCTFKLVDAGDVVSGSPHGARDFDAVCLTGGSGPASVHRVAGEAAGHETRTSMMNRAGRALRRTNLERLGSKKALSEFSGTSRTTLQSSVYASSSRAKVCQPIREQRETYPQFACRSR